MENANKVTIDAAWFAELYAKANQSHNCDDCKEVHTRTHERNIAEAKCKELAKERDELKAKLENREKSLSKATLGEFNRLRESLAEAERCIEDIDIYLRDGDYTREENPIKIRDVICAYRKAKESK